MEAEVSLVSSMGVDLRAVVTVVGIKRVPGA
jgi:hypothetical protein